MHGKLVVWIGWFEEKWKENMWDSLGCMSHAQTIKNARKVNVELSFGIITCHYTLSYYTGNTPHTAIILNIATTYWHYPMNLASCECCGLWFVNFEAHLSRMKTLWRHKWFSPVSLFKGQPITISSLTMITKSIFFHAQSIMSQS